MLQSEFSPAARAQLAETAVVAKRRKNLTWEQIAEGSGLNVAFVTAAILGQHPLSAETAKLVGERLDLSADDIQLLQSVPVRASLGIPTDPTLYRFHAMMQMYGPTLKALVHEKFGDGIKVKMPNRDGFIPDPEFSKVPVPK